jgi:hypothetical protein
MAFITKTDDTKCYSCGKQCINVEFCSAGASYDSDDIGSQGISISRNIRVSIVANPEFWGFSGVLISGWATYSNGYYDFFDGHDEDHKAEKTCSSITYGPFLNEQRPDVFYRSVYDPDTGISTHYGSDGSLEGSGLGRGGAEVYLINRRSGLVAGVSSDNASCATANPTQVFKQFPENYGWGNKINFNTKIYKNLSGAWRMVSLENCHPQGNLYKPAGYLIDCSGNEKQNVSVEYKRFQNYEPSRTRASGNSSYYNYISGCHPDGSVAGKYAGYFDGSGSIFRSTSSSSFIQAKLAYGSLSNQIAASGLRNGMTIGIKNDVSGIFNNVYTIFDVTHTPTYTLVKFVGTTSNNTQPNSAIPTGDFSLNIGQSGHWVAFNTYDPQTCCGLSAYGISDKDKQFCDGLNYHTDFRRIFNHPKNILQSNRDPQWRYNYGLYDNITALSGILAESGRRDFRYPSIDNSGLPIIVSGSPVFEKQLSYYGDFFIEDKYDSAKRFEQAINRGKGRNATCYSKYATLEIFPDCVTQYDFYNKCVTETQTYVTNRLPRLAFVYRGCNFNDDCSFDASGLPLGGWKNQGSVPTGIEDLKRQLAGQEIHMFLNLGTAWGGRKPLSPCRCDCDSVIPGQYPPEHIQIPSPITFPSFPNFDLNPTGYGCKDARYQLNYKRNETGGYITQSGFCDPLPTSNYACMVKQPYVTYGYIMNLCGKETKNRKDVITEAFSKLHQDKTYTNANPTGNITEPMYWNIVAPNPTPFGGSGGVWSSGSSARGDSGGSFSQIGGSGYGFWGLADSNKQVVAPYFCTKQSSYTCCTNSGSYLDYNTTGTLTNILGTSNGWPTSKVPFLIEIEVDDSCVGCASSSMKAETLNLEINGLNSEFIWQQLSTRYGHNYCKYGAASVFGKAKTEPSFTCVSGFNLSVCGNDSLRATYGDYYTGNTCSCINGFNVTLHPVVASGSSGVIIGWTSNQLGGGAGMVELTGCNDFASAYLDADYFRAEGGGYRVFAQFDLACPDLHQYINEPYYPDVYYENNPISAIWGNANSCSHHYPARIGENGDLDLQTTLYLVAEQNVDIFKKLTSRGLRYKNFSQCLTLDDFSSVDNPFGICPGEKVYTYGCSLGAFFYGCNYSGGYPGSYPECNGNTPCNTCPTGTGSGTVVCSCGSAIGYEGIFPRRLPANYQLNECACECKDPALIAIYNLTSTGLVLVSGASAACASVYWAGTDKISPTLINCPTPQPFIGIKLGTSKSTDWYDWSHGVNSVVSGVRYELNKPFLNTEECNTLRRLPYTAGNNATNIDCTIASGKANYCNANSTVNTKTCGNPVYSTGSFPSDAIRVRKKKCHPEVAIVNKIECLGSGGYKLYVSREYHEHDRTWYEVESSSCKVVNAGAYVYNDGTTSGCQLINYSILADSVTPAYTSPCSTHPSSGSFVTQDYKYQKSSFPSGSHIWNYFNLFYSSGFLPTVANGYLIPSVSSGFACTGTPATIVNSGTVFGSGSYLSPSGFNGIFATNLKHSCVQDSAVCGGDLWCNKMFFPRHEYKAGTRIAPFGSPSICTANNEFKSAFELDGYDENGQTISGGKDILNEQKSRFFDWCNDSIIQLAKQDIGIDSTEIIVDDYLPLIGVIHPGWKFTSDIKSCTVGGTGCQDILPVHSDISIAGGIHEPKTYTTHGFDSMGYYLDKSGISYNGIGNLVGASGANQCLFNPFKILIDVECSLNRIARKNFPSDSPTYLHGVQTWPVESCLGMVGEPGCGCSDTKCQFASSVKQGECTAFQGTSYIGTIASGTYTYCPSGIECSGCGLSNCEERNGIFIQIGSPVGKFFDPNIFTSISPIGELAINSTVVCYCQSGSGTTSGVYTNVAGPLTGSWALNTCDGSVYQLLPSGTRYVRKWTCQNNQYINKAPSLGYTSLCDCESDINEGLCDAKYRCADFSTCACQEVGQSGQSVPNITTIGAGGSGTWWSSDCGCEAYPKAMGACGQDSLIEWQITE